MANKKANLKKIINANIKIIFYQRKWFMQVEKVIIMNLIKHCRF